MRKVQGGFTLIELIIVVVILGILAAVALPRFMGMSTEAHIAKMQGAAGAVSSAAAMAHAKYLAAGSPSDGKVTIEGTVYTMVNGYPSKTEVPTLAGLNSNDFDYTTTAGTIADKSKTTCSFTYTEAASASTPASVTTTNINTTNCGG